VRTEWLTTKSNEPLLAYARHKGDRSVIVLLNFSAQPQVADLSISDFKGRYTELFTGRTWNTAAQSVSVVLPWAAQVWTDLV
jgi:hypothetical protein